ncbi:hypothetical protein BBK36DRAFT_1159928 [Trichoderma citrinoviride]|uniref:Uncharacterized protein n=1 Tax=Trichoderma citrinoviride TaxID=58853 RepID=A0A2T4B9A9_9HYPO|nr:hypothetical protein BBK36DRAFT_1159928 [Trichoderma citrinoviride]PTB65801.1 hypothetical protein BBK36DRAFT_1159928 [Trichoderma citrinoviride]
MDQTSWLDLSLSPDGEVIPIPPSPPQSPPSVSPPKLTRSKSLIERATSRASQHSPSPNVSSNTDDHHHHQQLSGRPSLPPWDRTVDVVYHKYAHGEAGRPEEDRKTIAVKVLTNKFFALHKRNNNKSKGGSSGDNLVASYETLGSKPIGLNPFHWDQDCWEPSDFTPLRQVLATFRPYMSVSFDFHSTIFITILSAYTFHVTFSPFTAQRLNPLATTWLNKYSPFMSSLIIEIDLSRLGLGPSPQAANLLPCTTNLQRLLHSFSLAQLQRSPEAPLESLILACRRFHGQREDLPEPPLPPPPPPPPPAPSDITKVSARAAALYEEELILKNQSFVAEISGRLSSCDIPGMIARALSPAPDESFKQSEVSFEDSYIDQDAEGEQAENSYIYSDDNDDEDASIINISFISDNSYASHISYSSSSSSSSDSDSDSDSDSSSNPGTSLAIPHSIPEEEDEQGQQPPPSSYCPDKHLSICNHLVRLRNNVTSLRMAGFSEAYTNAFIATLFPESRILPLRFHAYRVAPSTFWPRLRYQKSMIDNGRAVVLDDHQVIPEPGMFPEGPVQLPAPIVYKCPSLKSLPAARNRSRNNTASSGSSWPSQKSLESNEEANTSKSSLRSSYEKSVVQKLLERYRKSRRMPRPTSAP